MGIRKFWSWQIRMLVMLFSCLFLQKKGWLLIDNRWIINLYPYNVKDKTFSCIKGSCRQFSITIISKELQHKEMVAIFRNSSFYYFKFDATFKIAFSLISYKNTISMSHAWDVFTFISSKILLSGTTYYDKYSWLLLKYWIF